MRIAKAKQFEKQYKKLPAKLQNTSQGLAPVSQTGSPYQDARTDIL